MTTELLDVSIDDRTELERERLGPLPVSRFPAGPPPATLYVSASLCVDVRASDEDLAALVAGGTIRPIHARWLQWLRGEATPAETPGTFHGAASTLIEKWQQPKPDVSGGLPRIDPKAVRVVRIGLRGAVYAYERVSVKS